MTAPGIIALMGSGETTYSGGQIFESVAACLGTPLHISVLETPAGFEVNSALVAGRVVDFLKTKLQNYQPIICQIPARKKGTIESPDNEKLVEPLFGTNMIFLGPGSPSYAVRQLKDSLAWNAVLASHRQGNALVLASAATISIGSLALPVYEIFKVGEELHWKPGLELFGPFGLSLVFVPHWNNCEGGEEFDTSRCFMGRERFDQLFSMLPENLRVVGIDENTGLILDFEKQECKVLGKGKVHIDNIKEKLDLSSGEIFPLTVLGHFLPLIDLADGIDEGVWIKVKNANQLRKESTTFQVVPPVDVLALAQKRQFARQESKWDLADHFRREIFRLGWKVNDTPTGFTLEKINP